MLFFKREWIEKRTYSEHSTTVSALQGYPRWLAITIHSAVCNSQWSGRLTSICWVRNPPSLKEIINQSSGRNETLQFPSPRIFFLSFFFFKGNFVVSICKCPQPDRDTGVRPESFPVLRGKEAWEINHNLTPSTQRDWSLRGFVVCHELLQDFVWFSDGGGR